MAFRLAGSRRGTTGNTYGMRVGKLTSPEGHCEVIETRVNRAMKHYSTTVHSLKLNLELFDLTHCLKDAGREIDFGLLEKHGIPFK